MSASTGTFRHKLCGFCLQHIISFLIYKFAYVFKLT